MKKYPLSKNLRGKSRQSILPFNVKQQKVENLREWSKIKKIYPWSFCSGIIVT